MTQVLVHKYICANQVLMKKTVLLFLLLMHYFALGLYAQNTAAQGFRYQAVARDASGQVLVHQNIALRISLSSNDEKQTPHYAEVHEVKTDALGLFHLIIGRGKEVLGTLDAVPFAKTQIWLDVALDPQGQRTFSLVNRSELMSVPYAFHAATTSQLIENTTELNLPTEKNQSLYWTTSGNTNTRPPTHFIGTRDSQDLVFKTDNTTRMIITADGRIKTFGTCVDNGDQDTLSYAILAQGCKQGIYIKVNGTRDGDNNFVTFADDEGIWGRIEGQTTGELFSSFEYLFENAVFSIKTASIAANVTGLAAELVVVLAQLLTFAEAVPIAAQAKVADARFGFLVAEWIGYNVNKLANVGVTYESGAGDYAEWLERSQGVRDLLPGEVVGVKGGKISLNTQDADHYMVVSTRPIVLGNMQAEGSAQYEKIAFLGQVPVRVIGKVNIGDYLIPSGNHDGFAVAIAPDQLPVTDHRRIIGVAWEAAKDAPLNVVNTAVGINKNSFSPALEKFAADLQETNQKVDQIIAYLEGNSATLPSATTTPAQMSTSTAPSELHKLFSDEAFDQIVEQNAALLNNAFSQIAQQLNAKGYDLTQVPWLQQVLQEPVNELKKLRRDPNLLSQWGFFDQQLQSRK